MASRTAGGLVPEQVNHVQAERDVLAASDNAWVVGLEYSFQDEVNLYMVGVLGMPGSIASVR